MKNLNIRMAIRQFFKLRILHASRKTLKNLSGSSFDSREAFFKEYYGMTAANLKMSVSEIEQWEKGFYKNFTDLLHRDYCPRPGLEAMIRNLNVPCAVLSDYDRVDDRLRALGIDPELFVCRIYSGDAGGLKPSVNVFRYTAECMGIEPSKILVAGDKIEKDGKGAEEAGMDFFLINEKSWPLFPMKFSGDI